MGGGGGGTGGQFTFPHSSDSSTPTGTYSDWVEDIETLIDSAESASPYSGETSPDPDTFFNTTDTTRVQGRVSLYNTIVDALDDETDFDDFVDKAKEKADEDGIFPSLYDSSMVEAVHANERTSITTTLESALEAAADTIEGTALDTMRDAYEKVVKRSFMRAMSRMASGMSDIGAVNSTAFVWGMASIENEILQNINNFAAQQGMKVFDQYVAVFMTTFTSHMQTYLTLTSQKRRSRDLMVIQGASQLAQMLSVNLDTSYRNAMTQAEVGRMRHAAAMDEHQTQLHIDAEDAQWALRMHKYGANMLAAAGGAAIIEPQMSKTQSALGGAFSGAAAGLAAGGPVGGILGGVAGLIGGL